ncbi:MAG: hypothetical protein ACYC91_10905 [Solirubrobacteraceae bacterium]
MTGARRIRRRGILGAMLAFALGSLAPPGALADHAQQSIFQDDQYLVYSPPYRVEQSLGLLKELGVQEIRVNLKWSAIAPAPTSRRKPAHFNPTNPAAYPAAKWLPFDRLVLFASQLHIAVQFNLTAPGPLWAMAGHPVSARAADHWAPSATQFYEFVYAVGLRYSGRYGPLPRISDWSVWNEPNQPGWLAPQWRKLRGGYQPDAPRLYRGYVRSAYAALYFSGHGADKILIGELAPEGYSARGAYVAMTPMPFLRALYCVDARWRPVSGRAASWLGCPRHESRATFVKANPGLFDATGFAHHPYYFFHPPSYSAPDPDFVPIANLGRLERGLDRVYRAYHVHRRIPIYLTEYGYQTDPPDPYEPVSPAQQAAYLNQADYMAWRDPRVRSVAQFLLFDAAPDPRYRPTSFKYWDTFQTGLLFASGKPKPALLAYELPIWLPVTRLRRGARALVWAQLRPASSVGFQRAEVQWRRPGGAFRTLAVSTTNATGYLTARVRPPASGTIRIAWPLPSGRIVTSRGVTVRVG